MDPGTTTDTLVALVSQVSDLGVLGVVLAYFIWRDRKKEDVDEKREGRMSERINELEDFQKDEIAKLVEKTADALTKNAEVLGEFSATIKGRPCMIDYERRD